jgi:hypothetical protein
MSTRMVLAVALAVVRSWRNRIVAVVGGRAQYRLLLAAVVLATIIIDGTLAVSAGRQAGAVPLSPDLVYPSMAGLALVIGLALAAMVAFLVPERGELDSLLGTTLAGGSIRRIGQELPVLAILSLLAAVASVPLTTSLLGFVPSVGRSVGVGFGAFLLVATGLLTGRCFFVAAVLLVVRMHGGILIGRLVAAATVLLASGLALTVARPADPASGRAGFYRMLGAALDGTALTPVALCVSAGVCAASLLVLTLLPVATAAGDTSAGMVRGVAPLVPPSGRWGPWRIGRRAAVALATIATVGREPTFQLSACLVVSLPALLLVLERLTQMPLTVFVGYAAILAGLTAGYVHGASRAVRVLLAGGSLGSRQWFWPQLAGTAVVTSTLLLTQTGIAIAVAGQPLSALTGTWALAAIAAAVALVFGRVLPVRSDSTSWTTLDVLGILTTVALLYVLLRQNVADADVAIPAGSLLLLAVSVTAVRWFDARHNLVEPSE